MSPPSTRRILMTADAVGGVWVYATELARALCRADCEVTLVVLGPHPRPEQLRAAQYPGLRIEITDLALEWMEPDGVDVPRARDTLLRIAQRTRPDVVHLNGYREANLDWPAPVLVAAHSCVWSWWRVCRGGAPDEPRWRAYAEAVACGLSAADAWVAPTRAFRDTIEALYRPRVPGRIIRNGLELASHPLPKEPFVFAAGRLWDEAKNLAALAAVAAKLDWPVRIAGTTRAPDAAGEVAIEGAELLGELSRPDLIAQLRRAAVFVSPARYEPFGLTVLEAAASGCALVLADIPSFRELWGGAALLVDPSDRDALCAALQAVCADGGLRQKLQRAARIRARRHSLDSMVASYRYLYGTLCGRNAPARESEIPELRG